tara:strand:+ start:1160 stop:1393 length:234 start_codon:yes stop_codon:yes gene_type:complete
MGTIIIYATLLLNGMVHMVQYKGETFKTHEDCIAYLQEYNSHVNKTLKEHIDKVEKGSTVLFIGCSEIHKSEKDVGV